MGVLKIANLFRFVRLAMPRPRYRACLQDGLKLNVNNLLRKGWITAGALSGPYLMTWRYTYTDEEICSALISSKLHVDEFGVACGLALLDEQFDGGPGGAAHRMPHRGLGDVEDLVMAVAELLGGALVAFGHRHQDLGAGLGGAMAHAQLAQRGHHLLQLHFLAGQAQPQRRQQRGGLEVEVAGVGMAHSSARPGPVDTIGGKV